MTPLERADRANQLLNDEVLKGALVDIRAGLVAKLEACEDMDREHDLVLQLKALKALRTELAHYGQVVKVDQAKRKHMDFIERVRKQATRMFPGT